MALKENPNDPRSPAYHEKIAKEKKRGRGRPRVNRVGVQTTVYPNDGTEPKIIGGDKKEEDEGK